MVLIPQESKMRWTALFFLCCIQLISSNSSLEADDISGLWKTIDDKSGKAECVVVIYPHNNLYYGRIVATYDSSGTKLEDTLTNARKLAPGVKGSPTYVGVDILWDLEPKGKTYKGKVADPLKGKSYDAELWVQNGKLIVRGKLLFFSRSQAWEPLIAGNLPASFVQPDIRSFKPSIPVLVTPKT
jgi:uncharacterized protein (DUF2147 family)